MSVYRTLLVILIAVSFSFHISAAHAQVEIIATTAGPKSDIGLKADSLGFMYSFAVSPDGSWWAGEFELTNALDSIHLRGSAATAGDIIWTEGEPLPGGLTGNFRSSLKSRQTAINNQGVVVGTADNSEFNQPDEFIYRFDGSNVVIVAAETDIIPGIPTANYGSVLESPNAQADGLATFVADNITGTGITTSNDSIGLADDGSMFAGQQKGVTQYSGFELQRIDSENYFTTPDGSIFLFSGDTTADTAIDDIVVLGVVGTQGSVVLEEGVTPVTTILGPETFDAADQIVLTANGDWYARGDTITNSTDVVIRNGTVLASEGESAPDGFLYDEHIALAADQDGNHAWIWFTTNPDADRDSILVYNGDQILISEGDTIMFDYTGDGFDDPAVIEHLILEANSFQMAGGYVYLMVEVDQPDTTFIGHAFIRIPTPAPATTASGRKFLDGFAAAGTLSDLHESDDIFFDLDPSPTKNPAKQKVDLILTSETQVADPTSLSFVLESAMSGGPVGDVLQEVSLWNDTLSDWESIDTRAVASTDTRIELDQFGDLTRFVHPLTGEVLVKLTWTSPVFAGTSFNWSIQVDQGVWFIK